MNSDNKTLVILTPGFPANEADSTCLPFPQLFVKTLARESPSLNIIVLAFQYPFTASEYQWHGIKVIALNGRNKGKLRRLGVWKVAWKRLNAIVKENDVLGILSLWLGECALLAKWAARKHGLRWFAWLLGQDARKNNRYCALIKPAARNLVALSDFIADEFYWNYGVMPANTIPPGIDTDEFPNRAATRDIDILGAGSLIPLKRYDIFITVVGRLARTNPGIKTMICGGGPERASLQKMIDGAKLAGNILLCGELPHAAVLALMRRSKIFLHPSSYEGFATVLTEALYAGTRVVGFCQPMHTVFKNQHVVKTADQMADKLSELLGDNNENQEGITTWPIAETCRKILGLYGV